MANNSFLSDIGVFKNGFMISLVNDMARKLRLVANTDIKTVTNPTATNPLKPQGNIAPRSCEKASLETFPNTVNEQNPNIATKAASGKYNTALILSA
ncbi:hypothetical protein FACS1894122_06560 [Alphaproteobacteria bacterium]|nr:hypothetical protein FACS1894122_06560 [Alphaproteobacteria bacterium]